ncbi:hypothetical protein [Rhodococcus koreensis]|uniref:hypothetical protein n=1 Tax=Rhodococcus koreensis TaxID=99653 RepID=UPI00197D1A08|nr:hypothetical protein [Rhodococcus koreensis]QSE86997.1 hypothetical protein JWS14_49380 [Rhodococcus koreensis]
MAAAESATKDFGGDTEHLEGELGALHGAFAVPGPFHQGVVLESGILSGVVVGGGRHLRGDLEQCLKRDATASANPAKSGANDEVEAHVCLTDLDLNPGLLAAPYGDAAVRAVAEVEGHPAESPAGFFASADRADERWGQRLALMPADVPWYGARCPRRAVSGPRRSATAVSGCRVLVSRDTRMDR